MRRALLGLLLGLGATAARAEEITVATYNIEWFSNHFISAHLSTATLPKDPGLKAALSERKKKNDEDNWETAQVILDPKFSPDILGIEEGCADADLKAFNHQWLKDAYATAVQFPGNSKHGQYLGLLIKPGFKVLETRDQYYKEPDPVGNERGEGLFARGPAFVKVETPTGAKLWFGVTHMKSKYVPSGGDGDAKATSSPQEIMEKRVTDTKWRNREAARTHQIIKELEKEGPSDVILVGDMNDALGFDDTEKAGGGDTIANLTEPASDGLSLVTKAISDGKQYSFHGYWREKFREVIDHMVVTKSLKPKVQSVRIVREGMAPVASDHFPVMARIKTK